MAEAYVTNGEEVQKNMRAAGEHAQEFLRLGLLRAALHLIARAKALSPEDTTTLVQSIHSDNRIIKSGDSVRVEVGAHAMSGDENYGIEIHEDQEYEGPNVGGARTIGLGPKTEAKGISPIEPSDGAAGGKYLARPCANKPEQYALIIANTIKEKLDGGRS